MKMTTVCWIFAGLVFICPCLLTSSSLCRRNAFKCSLSGVCIPLHWRCDGEYQCGDGDTTDEVNCTSDWKGRCPEGSHRCSNSRCLPGQWVCDGERQCEDGSDEDVYECRLNRIGCSRNEFYCGNETCIPRYLRCDNKDDCLVNSNDELYCGYSRCYGPSEHRCGSGSCLSPLLLCDGLPQCNDSSDERDCDKCENWGCAHDCEETSDGPQCYCRQYFELDPEDGRTCKASSPQCRRNEFKCSLSKACIPLHWRCDGEQQCGDGDTTDEVNCTSDWKGRCPKGSYRCTNSRCLPNQWACDGVRHCEDGSDEEGCGLNYFGCIENGFHCGNGSCIPWYLRCDNKDDCPANSRDEMYCEGSRCFGEHRCGSGRCLSPLLLCDGLSQCNDSSDERDCDKCEKWGCGHDCEETSDRPQCYCRQGFELDPEDGRTCKAHCLRNQFRCLDGKKCIPMSYICDEGADCDDESDEDERMCADRQCPIGQQHKCDGGLCLPDKYVCDGKWDCGDRTDEKECPAPPDGSCMENQVQCTDGSCVPIQFRCKGFLRQCLGRSDALACDRSPCDEAYERPCDDGTSCVWKSKVCDGYRHCSDESDENDCYTCENWGCSQNCTETSNWPRCHCNYGFALDDQDQKTCNPIFLVFSIDSSTSTAYVPKGGKFILSCRVRAQGIHPWYKDGSIISSNSLNKFYLEPDSTAFSPENGEFVTTMRLVVEDADSTHTGEYKCGRDGLYSRNVTVVTDSSIL